MFEKSDAGKRTPQRVKWGNVAKAVAGGAALLVALVWALGPLLGGGSPPPAPAAGYTEALKPPAQDSTPSIQLKTERQKAAEAAALKRDQAARRRKRAAQLRAQRKRQQARHAVAQRRRRHHPVQRPSSEQSSATASAPPTYVQPAPAPAPPRLTRGSEFLFG